MKNGVNTAITKNYSISILRVVGMFSIVFCHFFSWLGFSFLSQFLNFWVYLFRQTRQLYRRRQRIRFPYSGRKVFGSLRKISFYFWFFVCKQKYSRTEKLVFNTVEENISSILYFCNPHCTFVFFVDRFWFNKKYNISFLFARSLLYMFFYSFCRDRAPRNLWFITIILLCYLLTIILKNFEKKHNVSVVGATVVLLFIWLVPKILMCFSLPYIDTQYFVAYFIGYYISKFNVKNNKWTFWLLGLFMFAVAIVIRLTAKMYIDGIYESEYLVFVSLTQIAVAVSAYFICTYLVNNFAMLESMAKSKIWSLFDVMSYPIYITHYAFLTGMTSVSNFGFSTLISIVLFILFTVISSSILYLINNKIIDYKMKMKQ